MFRITYRIPDERKIGTTNEVYQDVKTVANLKQYPNIQSILPLFIEFADAPLTPEDVNAVIRLQEKTEADQELVNNVERLEKELAKARELVAMADVPIVTH